MQRAGSYVNVRLMPSTDPVASPVAYGALLRTDEVAERLDCSPAHVLNLIESRKLAAVDIGHRRPLFRVREGDLDAFIASRLTTDGVPQVASC